MISFFLTQLLAAIVGGIRTEAGFQKSQTPLLRRLSIVFRILFSADTFNKVVNGLALKLAQEIVNQQTAQVDEETAHFRKEERLANLKAAEARRKSTKR